MWPIFNDPKWPIFKRPLTAFKGVAIKKIIFLLFLRIDNIGVNNFSELFILKNKKK